MEQNGVSPQHAHDQEISEELRSVLISLGRGLGTVSVYGMEHPSVELIIDATFENLHAALQNRKSITIGTFKGTLTVDDQPVVARDVPIRTLEKRLASLRVSHLALSKGLTRNELKKLLAALCTPGDSQLKETLSAAGLDHVEMSDVKYVALHNGEQKTGSGGNGKNDDETGSGADEFSPLKVSRIVAFLKGEASGAEVSGDVKKMLSDPERLGQMIMEAAAIRQSTAGVQDGEAFADVVIGCLRRTFGGLRKEADFQTPKGRVNLTKALMLLEKTVLDKIHLALGAQHPEIDRRIFDAVREMEEQQQFEILTAHYFDQRRKMDDVESKMIKSIREQGAEKAREQPGASDIPLKNWQRLVVKAGTVPENSGGAETGLGLDMSALAVVLEKLEGLMRVEHSDPFQIKTTVDAARNGLGTYADRIEAKIQELEEQIELRKRNPVTIEDHADHLGREELIIEVSKLTLTLLQPLTVVNASVEAAIRHADKETQKDLLNLAYESGKRMQSLTHRLMTLVGYPMLFKK